MKKRLRIIFFVTMLILAACSLNAFAFSSDHMAVTPINQAIDVLIAADNTYTGDIDEFKANLAAALGSMGTISDAVKINKTQSDISLANFDDWYVYDHYYNPNYPTDGSQPADWDDFSGRHPYDYYRESSYENPMSAILSAELVLHDTLWPAYTAAVADLNTFGNTMQLYQYTGERYPYKNLSGGEQATLEPQIVLWLNYYLGTSFTSLNDYYLYIFGNEAYYNEYYFTAAYGAAIYPSLSGSDKTSVQHDFYYDRYITAYTYSSAYSAIVNYIDANYDESDLFITNITDPGNKDWVYLRDKHIYTSIDAENNASITFMGYSAPGYKDFLLYPMTSGTQRTVNFDIDASMVYTHTLEGAGFLINSGIDASGYITGYILFYDFDSDTAGTVSLLKINADVLAATLHNEMSSSILNYTSTLFSQPFAFNEDSLKKNINITISATSVTCVDTNYADETTLDTANAVTLFGETKALDDLGVYGYGPITSFSSHGCSQISAFTFLNLKMKYESSSVEALRNATYIDEAKKIYIILTDVPEMDTSSEAFYELLTRLNQDQIFYVTGGGNAVVSANGSNGLDLSASTDPVGNVADYLKDIYDGTVTWNETTNPSGEDLLPVAIFDIFEIEGLQILTIDQRHIGTDSYTLTFANLDKSVALAPGAGTLTYDYTVYDPNGDEVTLAGQNNNELIIDASSVAGDYTFSLIVSHGFTDPEDTRILASLPATRTLTVLNDTEAPTVTRVGGSAVPHTGDSITLNLSDAGSGVAAYAIGKAIGSAAPTYADEIILPQPVALTQLMIPTSNEAYKLYLKVYDACGNELIWNVEHAIITSGGSGGSSISTYVVKATAGAGGSISPAGNVSVQKYADQTFTITPNTGYEIANVLIDGVSVGKTAPYTFKNISENHTIEATFTSHDTNCPSKRFIDLDTTLWYHEGIDYVLLAGLFNGTATNTFEPETAMTRAMLVTVLFRLEGSPKTTGSVFFLDVPTATWYTDAVVWAVANGIVEGYSAEAFGPDDPITREQMASILYRYAHYKGYDLTGASSLSAFTDAGDVSDWASTTVKWAVAKGLLAGISDNTLAPSGNASRAQVATILMRFMKAFHK